MRTHNATKEQAAFILRAHQVGDELSRWEIPPRLHVTHWSAERKRLRSLLHNLETPRIAQPSTDLAGTHARNRQPVWFWTCRARSNHVAARRTATPCNAHQGRRAKNEPTVQTQRARHANDGQGVCTATANSYGFGPIARVHVPRSAMGLGRKAPRATRRRTLRVQIISKVTRKFVPGFVAAYK